MAVPPDPTVPPAARADPVPPGTLPRFHETALASGLVDEARLQACAERVGRQLGVAARGQRDRWDAAVAECLVADGILTRFQAGQLLAGRKKLTLGQYRILEELGRGGMGQVFRARHALMGRVVAVKVLPRRKSTPESEAAFQREIRMLARLDHENLVRALDAGYDGKVFYLVTELVPGLDLRRQVLKHGPLDEIRAASVISQAARGLAYAHAQGVVHRDVKPANLLVAPEGQVKVLDLGLAGSSFEGEGAHLGRTVGTMDYMAPEQIRSADTAGPLADIYALGCALYFALTGEVPFPGGTRHEKAQRQLKEPPRPIRQLKPDVSEGMCRVVEAMMQKDPRDRPASAEAVLERLRSWTPPAPLAMPRGKPAPGSASGVNSEGGSDADAASRRFSAKTSTSDAARDPLSEAGQATRPLWSELDETGREEQPLSAAAAVRRGREAGLRWGRVLAGHIVAAACIALATGMLLVLAAGIDRPAEQRPFGTGLVRFVAWSAFGLTLCWRLVRAFGRRRG